MRNLSLELRPTTFDQLIGNQSTITALKNQLNSGRIPTAFMFSGSVGTGKTTTAYIIARELNCTEIIEVNCADTNGVDQMRELVSRTDYLPLNGKYRIVILDEAQQLTQQGQQVLLTTFEKKDSPTIYILCTTDPQKLLPALKDRCSKYTLKGLNQQERLDLVARVVAATDTLEDGSDILSAIEKAGLDSPRSIVTAVELWSNGLSADLAVENPETDPELAQIASSILNGKPWKDVATILKTIKPADAKNLRAVLSGFARNKMFNQPSAALAVLLKDLTLYQTPESGCDLGSLIAIIWGYMKP